MAVDLPGHGLSSHRPPGVLYSFPYYVMDMRRVIDGKLKKNFFLNFVFWETFCKYCETQYAVFL